MWSQWQIRLALYSPLYHIHGLRPVYTVTLIIKLVYLWSYFPDPSWLLKTGMCLSNALSSLSSASVRLSTNSISCGLFQTESNYVESTEELYPLRPEPQLWNMTHCPGLLQPWILLFQTNGLWFVKDME